MTLRGKSEPWRRIAVASPYNLPKAAVMAPFANLPPLSSASAYRFLSERWRHSPQRFDDFRFEYHDHIRFKAPPKNTAFQSEANIFGMGAQIVVLE